MISMKKTAGFSLIELMIAVSILAILLAIAAPSYRAWIQNGRIRNVAESIQNGLQLAKAEAVKRNTNIIFQLGADSGWSVGCVTVVVPTCPAVIQQRVSQEGSSSAVTVTPTPAVTNQVVFNNFGIVVPNGNTFTQVDIDINPSVLSPADSHEMRILIGAGGNVRLCSPGFAAPDPRSC